MKDDAMLTFALVWMLASAVATLLALFVARPTVE
jgi:hypothetical protein